MKKIELTEEERAQRRYEMSERYRKKVMRFTLQFNSRSDLEAREWFEKNHKSGAYLKRLILEDKARRSAVGKQDGALAEQISDLISTAVTDNCCQEIVGAIYYEVEKELKEISDYPNYNREDVRQAVGRVLVSRLGVET